MTTQPVSRGAGRLLAILFALLIAVFGALEAKNIGADPPNPSATSSGCPCPTCCKARTPVSQSSDTSTTISRTEGNLMETIPLQTTKSAGGATIDITAIYNSYNADGSRAAVDTVMGYGWTHSYNLFLFSQFGAMFRYDGTGRVTKYGLGAGGKFVTAAGYFETLTKTSSTTYIIVTKDKTVYKFASITGTPFLVGGPVWRLIQIVDRNGNTTSLTYSAGNLSGVTDTYGRTTTYTYTSLKKVSTITDPAGRVTTFTYDSTGHKLTGVTDPNGNTILYTYNGFYQLTGKTDRAGRTFTYSYVSSEPSSVNDSGSSSSATLSNADNWATDPNQLASNITRTYIPAITTVTDGRGNTWKYQYDSNGYLLKATAPDGSATTYTYDPATLLTASATDANGHATNYVYDSQGNTLKKTDALGNVTTYTYEPTFNMMTSMTDPRGRTTTYSIDPATGNLLKETDPLGQTRQWTYDAHGNVLTETDKNGNTTGFQYDSSGDLIKITDPLGNISTFTYDTVGNRLTATDPDSHTTSYQYDGLNRMTRQTDALSHISQTAYDGESNRIQTTDRNGHITTYQYDLRQRLIKTTDALGHFETYSYDGNDNRVSLTDRNGHATTYSYDVQNRVITLTDAVGDVSMSAYDGVGNQLTSTDANGHRATYTYDPLNRKITRTDAASEVTQYQYDTGTVSGCPACGISPGSPTVTGQTDANGKVIYYKYDALNREIDIVKKVGSVADTITPADAVTIYTYDPDSNRLSVTEPDGNTTTWMYDADNRVIQQANAAGDTATTTYDPAGNVIGVVTPNLDSVVNTYDALNRLVQVSDSGGLVEAWTYDNEGNRASHEDGNTYVTTYAYDAINRLVTVTDPLGKSSTTVYDAVGNPTSATDRNGNSTANAYDAINRRISTTDALGFVTQSQYDSVGNLIRLTDANSHTTQYGYDPVNRPSAETYADGTAKSYAYDSVGNVVARTDQAGAVTSYAYNDLYFLTGRTYPSATNDAYTYDLSGRMLSAQRGAWVTTFAYDGANRVTQTVQNGHTISYAYNIPGRTRMLTYAGGRVITENTDARNRMDHIDDVLSPPSIVQYAYDPGNRVAGRTYRNGVSASYSYNANDWITGLQHAHGATPISGFSYAYDNEGNKLFEDKTSDTTHSEAYLYDTTYRLINYAVGTLAGSTVPVPSTQTSYSLDGVGNWTSKTTNAIVQTRVHNSTNELTQINATSLTYDAKGNVLDDGSNTYTYDEENRLTSISGTVGQYQYDALSRRVQKMADPSGPSVTTQYFYDGDRVIEEQDGLGTTLATYTYGNYEDEVLTMTRGGSTYYYHQNANWSVEAITDSTATTVERYAYDAYGAVTVTDGSGTPVPPNAWGAAHSAIGNPYLFTGRQFDEESGLFYFRARFYSASEGRFLQREPMEYEDGMNLYEYVSSDPLKFTDPNGEFVTLAGTNCLGYATGQNHVQPDKNESFKDAMKNDGWTCKEKDDNYSGKSKDCECKCSQSMIMLYLKPATDKVDTWSDKYNKLAANGLGDFHAVRCDIVPKAGDGTYKCTEDGKNNWSEQPGHRNPGVNQNWRKLQDADDTRTTTAAYAPLTRSFCCCKDGATAAPPMIAPAAVPQAQDLSGVPGGMPQSGVPAKSGKSAAKPQVWPMPHVRVKPHGPVSPTGKH